MKMSEEYELCQSCGENTDSELYSCYECGNQICDECSKVCSKCNEYFCDGCFSDHKKKCK